MNLGLLLLRLVVGLAMASHGAQKLFGWFGGHGVSGTGAFFESQLGFKPGRTHATMAGLTEFGAGLALALGLLTPLAAAGIVGIMLVAVVTVHVKNGFFAGEGGYEYNLVLATAAASLAFTGPGRFSIDHALGWDLSGVVWGCVSVLFGAVVGACVLAGRGRLQEADDATLAGGREVGLERSQERAPTDTEV
ncbi:MAG TPA: DoxX family protein [Acidimicrobiales bacterium]|jgi:putative oxidoreductase|nr:DoxX family protein [Acidimicrobiales bacterium]